MLQEDLRKRAETDGTRKFVVGAVIHDEGHALLVTRSLEDDFLPGLEEVPSGGVEGSETLNEALHRELEEEVGFGAEHVDPDFIAAFDYQSRSRRMTRQFTVSVPLRGREVRLSDEHTSSRWITLDHLDAANATPETKEVLRQWFEWRMR
ncbi:NUDIX hydrolase [Nesterenkonia populi]|uniref:NUDIX hydrolase n=1 Tax=Nesterenkonia populi TaxID=1591087 RepID=UPI0014790267|nr:NUDIX domain-containing protein [Nesterenkonia populi]